MSQVVPVPGPSPPPRTLQRGVDPLPCPRLCCARPLWQLMCWEHVLCGRSTRMLIRLVPVQLCRYPLSLLNNFKHMLRVALTAIRCPFSSLALYQRLSGVFPHNTTDLGRGIQIPKQPFFLSPKLFYQFSKCIQAVFDSPAECVEQNIFLTLGSPMTSQVRSK